MRVPHTCHRGLPDGCAGCRAEGEKAATERIEAALRERADFLFGLAERQRRAGQSGRADKREVAGMALLSAADTIAREQSGAGEAQDGE